MRAPDEGKRGLEEMAGYLLWNAEVEEARRKASSFAANLPWLTTSQRDDVERVYVADRVAASRAILERNRDRAVELRGEYSTRYEDLKRRCVAAVLGAVAVAVGVGAGLVLFTR
ncbi:hypothetical protein [Streptomyces sp. NBC_01198]|uniref:hypothetical protein n=1 Tax=Streptomyces sp. NBC_01198 TaxID=2903769 RepID=UPI002E0F209F|nr:hypothetical protein OG702_02945 [Streptomyces sp. NBC_01198]